jgi:hypothetical protein
MLLAALITTNSQDHQTQVWVGQEETLSACCCSHWPKPHLVQEAAVDQISLRKAADADTRPSVCRQTIDGIRNASENCPRLHNRTWLGAKVMYMPSHRVVG